MSETVNKNVDWLRHLVRDVLDFADPVPETESFFRLGATSREIVQLQARISARIGCELPLRMMFSYPTVTELAACVSAVMTARGGSDSLFIDLNEFNADAPTILLAHTQGGEVADYAGFVQALHDSPVNLIGMEAPGLTPHGRHVDSIEELAEMYLAEIDRRRLRADIIVGYSFGALTAFELARTLRDRIGFQPLLCLIEPGPPVTSGPPLSDDPLEYWIWHYGEVADIHIEDLRPYQREDEMIDYIISRLKARGTLGSRYTWVSPARARELMRALKACLIARWRFCPSAADLEAVIYLTSKDADGGQNSATFLSARVASWQEVLGGQVRAYRIDGDHNSCMMGSNAQGLAHRLVGLLN